MDEMHMKHFKMTALAACAVLAFGFAACSSGDDSSSNNNNNTNGNGGGGNTSYTVTIASTIENGKVTADKTSAVAGETITLTATPADGYTLDSFSVTDANTNAITVTNGAFTMPESNVTVSATFKVSRVEATGKIGKYENPYLVGDIVFSDGSATPYADGLTLTEEQKTAAIAVIFYVGTDCSNDSTSRTLGVGLAQNQSGLAWCTQSANAYNKNITTIQCPASGSAGSLTFTGDKDGSDNFEHIGAFLTANNSTDDTATEANYPAFYYAKNYASQTGSHVASTDYASDWYLPSIAELFQVWKSRETVNAAIEACGGTKFILSYYYWSSSQYASYDSYACLLDFGSGDWNYYVKINGISYVCAVRAFN